MKAYLCLSATASSRLRLAFAALAFSLPSLGPALAAERLALIVANSQYTTLPVLKNPVNDGQLIKSKLEAAQFKVTLVENANRESFVGAVQDFTDAIKAAGPETQALFYYAGHGMQDDQLKNYLVPVDATLRSQRDLPLRAVSSESILETLDRARPKVAIVVLDACRDNPLPATQRSAGGRGLGLENQRTGFLIAFSTKPGDVAQDGNGTNSPYAEALASEMSQPGEAETVFRKVRVRVIEQTKTQQPWETTSLTQGFSFMDGIAAVVPDQPVVIEKKPADKPVDVREAAPPAPDPLVAFGEAVRVDTIEGYQRVLREFPNHLKRETIIALIQRKQAEGLWDEIQRAPSERDKVAKCEVMATAYGDSAYADKCQQLKVAMVAKDMSGAATLPAQARVEPAVANFYYVTGLDPNGDNWLALRNAPSYSSSWSATRMGPGTLLTKLGEQGEWMNVRTQNGETGWANSKFLACCRAGSSPAQASYTPQTPTPAPYVPPQQPSPSAGSYYYVTGLDPNGDNWLALRNAPSYSSAWSATRMGPGTLLTRLGQQGDWMNVRTQSGETGWANAKFIACCRSTGGSVPKAAAYTPPASSGGNFYYVTGLDPSGDNWLALRNAPSYSSKWSSTRMGPGTLLTRLGQDGDWMNVRLQNGETGWANSKFVACCRSR